MKCNNKFRRQAIINIVLLSLYSFYVQGQNIDKSSIKDLVVVDGFNITDRNWMEFVSDSKFSERHYAILMNNNEFIKSDIGINKDSIDNESASIVINYPIIIRNINDNHDSIIVRERPSFKKPVIINGHKYYGFLKVYSKSKMQLVTMADIKRLYALDGTIPCIFMINGITLIKDILSYKIDKKFILRVDIVKSKEIESLSNIDDFYIIKIYTKTDDNKKRCIIRLE